jgi:signal transduction histidine kinase
MVAAHQKRQVTADELSLLASIGQEVGMAVENARLYEQAEQAAVMTERSRLARELHDSVTQLLYSVTLYAEAAAQLLGSGQTITAAEHLRELRDTAQEALRETRLLIFELHRPDIGKGGLVAALQARLEAVESRGGMHADLHSQGVERLPRPLQEELYNIAQEALNNALKHAHAKSVHIGLHFEDAAAELEVSDDGVGFEPATEQQQSGGFGISGMRERAEKIGGTIEIDAAPGRGTRVFVRVPLKVPERTFPDAS